MTRSPIVGSCTAAFFTFGLLLAASARAQPAPDGAVGPLAAPQRPETGEVFEGAPISRETMRPLRPGESEPASLEAEGEAPPPDAPTTPGISGALAPSTNPNLDELPDLDAGEGTAESGEEARRRLWRLVPLVASGVVYDDNLFLRNTDRQGDVIFNFDAGFAFELGDFRERQDNYLLLSYLGSAVFYGENSDLDSYNPNFSLFGQYRSEPLTYQLESAYIYQRGVERIVGGFTTQNIIRNSLRALYDYSDKTTLDLAANQLASIYPDNISSYYYEVEVGFDYQLTSKLKMGLAGIAGFVEAEESPTMYYQTLNIRLAYEATGKLDLHATGGLEFNEYASGGEPLRLLPVFSVALEYLPFSGTALSLLAYRDIQNSPSLVQQDYISTGVEFGLSQIIGRRFAASLALGYENDTYVSNVSTVTATRVDNYVFARPGLSYSFLKYLTASIFYEYRTNDSNLEIDTWYDNRVTFEVSAEF